MTLSNIASLKRGEQPLRKTVRRLRWFKTSFQEQVEQAIDEKGLHFIVNEQKQAAAFIDWLRAFEAQKPNASDSRRDYVGFAAGLMLRALVKHNPLSCESTPSNPTTDDPAYFWPEGYVYVAYCLNVRAAVLEQDFDETVQLAPTIADIKTWHSFRENVKEDPNLGIAFLDLFAGDNPQWTMPDLFRAKDVKLIASHLMNIEGPRRD